MTVKELITILNALPSNATVVYAADRFIADEVIYDDYDNTVTFAGTQEFDDPCEYCEAGTYHGCYNDIPEDIDENNCEIYEACPADEMW